MSDGSPIVNLRTTENSAPKFGLPDFFEARFPKDRLDAEKLGVSLQSIAAGERAPFAHRHKKQAEELYVVVAGGGTVSIDGEEHRVTTWDVVRVSGQSVRFFTAGDNGIEFVAFGEIQPPNDAEMVDTGSS
ncbi:MAG TPA: cupin domain-containing protein [Gaiellaceae bacterium]|jgi:uncharacterized cupin superfamily protein